MLRKIIDRPISLGLRVLDGVLTCGEGQRMGIFAAAGGGKSTLLSSIIKGCSADVCVLALIGERGREVREFIENDLGPEGRKKAVLVVSTSDRSSMERLKAAYTATAVAEYFRDQHKSVLLDDGLGDPFRARTARDRPCRGRTPDPAAVSLRPCFRRFPS